VKLKLELKRFKTGTKIGTKLQRISKLELQKIPELKLTINVLVMSGIEE